MAECVYYHPIKNTHNNFHQSRKRPCRDGTSLSILFQKWTGFFFFLNRNSAKRTAAVLTCLKICRVRKKRGLWLSQDASILNVTESMPELSSKVVFGCKRSKISKWPVLSEQSSWDWPLPWHWCQMKKRISPLQNKSKGCFSSRENLIISMVRHMQAVWKVPFLLQRRTNGSALKVSRGKSCYENW